jgi:hypothetical protein
MNHIDLPHRSDFRPKYFELLSDRDQLGYSELRSTLSSQMCRNRRGKRLENFNEMMASIRAFCVRPDEDDWKRCLVCGVYWLSSGIAMNNRQLSLLLDKCKSSINGSLQKMGYSTLQARTESSDALSEAIPVLKNNFNELREWTVRLFLAASPQPSLPVYSVETRYPFQSPMPAHYRAFPMQHQVVRPPAPIMPVQPQIPQISQTLQTPRAKMDDYFDGVCLLPTSLAADPVDRVPGSGFGDFGDPFSIFDKEWGSLH